MACDFNEAEAFSRNIGWVTETEQYQLRGKRVAIAGLGGVGGAHLLTLARLGVGKFYIADLDTFKFEIVDERHLVVHGFDTREHVVYDLQGHASQLALGGLLETLEIAAQGWGFRCEVRRREDLPDTTPTFDVKFF